MLARKHDLAFFQRQNPIVNHTVLRKRATLGDMGLLEKIAVDVRPSASNEQAFFDGMGLFTNPLFDSTYQAAIEFTNLLRKRNKAACFIKNLMLQRICSGFEPSRSTAASLLEKGVVNALKAITTANIWRMCSGVTQE